MPEIFNLEQIERALLGVDVTAAIEEGFVAYSEGKVVVPSVGELILQGLSRLECILLDECHLTNVRTAAAGAVVAKYLAPKKIERIGVLGPRRAGQDAGGSAAADRRLQEEVVCGRRVPDCEIEPPFRVIATRHRPKRDGYRSPLQATR